MYKTRSGGLFSLLALLCAAPAFAAPEYDVVVPLRVEGSYAVFQGTAEVQGNAFSVGGSTLVVNNGRVGIGSANTQAQLDVTGAATSNLTGQLMLKSHTDDRLRLTMGMNTSVGYGYLQSYLNTIGNKDLSLNPDGGNVGIGIVYPQTKLHMSSGVFLIDGTGAGFKLRDGTQGANKVLTSDANGLGSWVAPGTLVSGDNLGSHVATTTLNMAGFQLVNVTTIAATSTGIHLSTGGTGSILSTDGLYINPGKGLYFTGQGNGTVIGNARGQGSVDLQSVRSLATQVAGGVYSVVSGGENNTASGSRAAVGGGSQNTASGNYSAVSGGGVNTASGIYSMVSGGAGNTALGPYSWAAGRAASSTVTGAFTWADSKGFQIQNTIADRTLFKNEGGFMVTGSTVGGSAILPASQAMVDVISSGTAANVMAQVWRDSGGTVISSMSATGNLYVNGQIKIAGGAPAANRILTAVDANGNSMWKDASLVAPGDNLGNHVATKTVTANYGIAGSTANFTSAVTASSFTATNALGIGAGQIKLANNVLITSGTAAQLGGVYISTTLYAAGDVMVPSNRVAIGTTTRIFDFQTKGTVSLGEGAFRTLMAQEDTNFYDAGMSGYHTPGAMIRKDDGSTDMASGARATLVLYNGNGTTNTGPKLVFAANETATNSNAVALAAITSQKVAGTSGSWATGNMQLMVKNGSDYTKAMTIAANGNVGVGTENPQTRLHMSSGVLLIDGAGSGFKLRDGTQGASKILTSDANGLASWQTASAVAPGDNLGNHVATTTLNMAGFNLSGASTLTAGTLTSTSPYLAVSTHIALAGTIKMGNHVAEKTFELTFPGAANEKADLYVIPGFWGTIDVTMVSTYYAAPAMGVLQKRLTVGANSGGGISISEGRYTDASYLMADHFAISNLTWDAANSRYRIQIVHRTTSNNRVSIHVRGFAGDPSHQSNGDMIRNMQIGAVYTSDATVFPKPEPSYAGKLGISTATPSYLLDVAGDALVQGQGIVLGSMTVQNAAGIAVPKATLASNVIISSATAAQQGGVYVSTNIYVNGKLRIVDGSQQNGYVLTSNASGLATWQSVSAVGAADNLGNHIATTTLNMAGFPVTGVSSITMVGKGLQIGTDISGSASGIFISTGGAIQTIGTGHGSVAGNARGLGAVDLQNYRTHASSVASGNFSALTGGTQNMASGPYSVVSGGWQNTADANASGVLSGGDNRATAQYASIAGGSNGRASGQYSTVSGGRDNKATGNYSAVTGGYNNTASGSTSWAAGYASSSTANGTFTWADSKGFAIQNNSLDRTLFKNEGGFMVTGSTVGGSAILPASQAMVDVISSGTAANVMAQVWRDSGGTVISSMSATGNLYVNGQIKIAGGAPAANRILTAVDANGNSMWKDASLVVSGDNLGNHVATTTLNMAGFAISNVSTITMQNGSIAIVPPGTGGSNNTYGVSIGSGVYDNFTYGVGLGYYAYGNNINGVGLGYAANRNYSYGVGVGASANNNYGYGVGVGYSAANNANYAVGVGAYSQNNQPYGAALGAYSYAASSSVALGYLAKANAWNSVAIGSGTVNNSSGTASFGNLAVYTSSDVSVGGRIKIAGGSPGANKVLTSDANGLASWATPASGADNLGSHVATTTLNMAGFAISNVSTITTQGGSIAIVPPGTGGSNNAYGISIGSNTYDNYNNGVGIGGGAFNNFAFGVGVGYDTNDNHTNGVGLGRSAHNNHDYGVGVGYGAYYNYSYGVGIGANAYNNINYAVGVGAYSQNNQPYGAALGAYSYAASSSVALGYLAKANAWNSVAIGSGTVNNSTGTASFGNLAVYTSSNVYANSLKLASGISANDLSDDTTLGDNSASALPTERAVKQYVDSKIAAGGGDTAWVRIGVQDLASAQTSVTFSGLNGDAEVEYMLSAMIVNGYAGSATYRLRPNNDSAANYGYQAVRGQSTTPLASNSTTETGFYITAAFVGTKAQAQLHLHAKSGSERIATSNYTVAINGKAIDSSGKISNSWNNTASNITSLVVASDQTNGLGAGTRIELWTRKGVSGTANTLDQSYDQGGPGVGREILADSGAVKLTGSNAADETLEVTNSANGGALLVENTGTGASLRVNDSAGDATPFIIDASGNVGISNGAPAYPFDVSGTARVQGQAIVTGSMTVQNAAGISVPKATLASNVIISSATAAQQGGVYVSTNIYVNGKLRMVDGSQALNKVLTSDANGLATWQTVSAVGAADNLGNHVATTTLQMGAYGINTSSNITAARYQINGSTIIAILPGAESIAFGVYAGTSNVTGGDYNLFAGYYAGQSNTSGAYGSFLGYQAGYFNTTGLRNSFLGAYAGYSNTSGGQNAITGAYAGRYNQTGSANTIVGYLAGEGTSGNSFSSSTIMGYRAGESVTTGSDNLLLGYRAGDSIAAGSGNIVLGYDQDTSAPGADSELNIGGVLYGDLSAKTLGISTRAPAAALDIVSTGSAANIYAQIWRNGTGNVVASMTSTGNLAAADLVVSNRVKIQGGTPGLNKVLTSDANGLATWQSVSAVGAADNLGNHIATTTLNMGAHQLTGTGALTMSSGTFTGLGVRATNLRIGTSSTEPGRIRFYDYTGYLLSPWTGTDADTDGLYWDTTNNQFQFHGGGNNRWSVDTDDGNTSQAGVLITSGAGNNYMAGNLGLGVTPAYKLDVSGTARVQGQAIVTGTMTVMGSSGVYGMTVSSNVSLAGTLYTAGGKVGVGTASPGFALDVQAGSVNSIGTGGYYYGGAGSPLSVELTRTIPVVANNYVEIGNFFLANGAHNFRVSITNPDGSYSTAKTYVLPVQYAGTGGVWKMALPLGDAGPYSGNDHALDINVNGNYVYLRLRRTLGTTAGTAKIRIESLGSTADVFTPTSATGGPDTPTAYYGGLYHSVVTNNVGVNDASPDAGLDIVSKAAPTAFVLSVSSQSDATGDMLSVRGDGSVGVGTASPGARLDVKAPGSAAADMAQFWTNSGGTVISSMSATGNLYINGQIKIRGGAPAANRILTAVDANGNATWQDPASVVSGDNLGNHVATTTLTMGAYQLTGTGSLTMGTATITGNSGVYGLTVSSNVSLAGALYTAGGKVGVGTASPGATLDVNGTIKIQGGTPGLNKVLTSDANGLATWATVSSVGAADNLGNHVATTTLNMANFAISNISTITMQNGSIAIVPPGTGGSNSEYGISIGSGAYDNFTYGVGMGYYAYGNNVRGVGLGYAANRNYSYGVGLGASASSNYSYGVGVGYSAANNANYAVGVGAYSQNNQPYGAALGAYSYAASSSVALGYLAKANAWNSVAIGSGTVNNSSGTASFGNLAVYTSSDVSVGGRIKIAGGSPGANKVLTSDANGLASWAAPASGADNLGDHVATKTITANYGIAGTTATFSSAVTVSSLTATNALGILAYRHSFGTNLEIASTTLGGAGLYISTYVYTPGLVITSGGALQTTGNGLGTFTGNTRGNGAVDLQVNRSAVTMAATGGYAVIAGGQDNTAAGLHSSVLGGSANTAGTQYSMVGGGVGNNSSGTASTIAGGQSNVASGSHGFVGGGQSNNASSGSHIFIGGGRGNTVSGGLGSIAGGDYNVVSGSNSAVGGGAYNTVAGTSAVVGGGERNAASGMFSVVGGGKFNAASGSFAFIGGGGDVNSANRNYASNNWASILGGWANTASGFASAIGGGGMNTAGNDYVAIPGGRQNTALGGYAAISGGYLNSSANTPYITIAGGYYNVVTGSNSVVGGGQYNTVAGTSAVVGGGELNQAAGMHSAVAGGKSNTIAAAGTYASIGGGFLNQASNANAVIGGGENNSATNAHATVGGGKSNAASGQYSAISGGFTNKATAYMSFVGGGDQNQVTNSYGAVAGGTVNKTHGLYAAIPGGLFNTASGYSSFAAGAYSSSTANGAFTWVDSKGYMVQNNVINRTLFKNEGGFMVVGSTVGGAAILPGNQAMLDVISTGATSAYYAQVWRDNTGLIVASMTANGRLTTLQSMPGDNLGNHTATNDLNMNGHDILLGSNLLHYDGGQGEGLGITGNGHVYINAVDDTAVPSLKIVHHNMEGSDSSDDVDPDTYFHDITVAPYYNYGGNPPATLRFIPSGTNHLTSDITFRTKNSGTLASADAERMRITYDGKVGIGTASPVTNFSVYSTVNSATAIQAATQGTQSAQQATLNLLTLNDGAAGMGAAGTKGWTIYARGDAWSSAYQRNDLGFSTWDGSSWADRLNIDAEGSVGIGTNNPLSMLHVSSGSPTGTRMIMGYADAVGSFGEIGLYDNTSSALKWSVGAQADSRSTMPNQFYVFQYKDAAEATVSKYRMVISNTGNMGLNTTAPSYALEVSTNTGGSVSFAVDTSNAASGYISLRVGNVEVARMRQ